MIKWSVEFSPSAEKEFLSLDKYIQRMIASWIEKNLVGTNNPRSKGKPLVANLKGRWRYRIGDYRLICELQDDRLVILCVTVGHRKEVYK